ncbi:MAG: type II toxin-antitoxin system VapC family toxin [Acidobacteria bacterium]|nr:type II toxin-antitoxin system VapC family toxin [Acidobacteriota bacterium]
MIALDTNVVVRILTADDPLQLAAARRTMRSAPLFLSKTVLLETEWVLRYSYEIDRKKIGEALRKLIRYRRMEVEDLPAVIEALAWHAKGVDFADALHLASSKPAGVLVTFDRKLAATAEALGCVPRVELLEAPDLSPG